MKKRFRLAIVPLVFAVVCAFMLIGPAAVHAAPASIVTCSGTGCDHQAPQNTQNPQGQLCSGNASDAISPVYGNGWTLDLRWGPNCQTNWARFGSAGGFASCFDLQVIRVYSSRYPSLPETVDDAYGCGPQNGIWTNQLFAPGPAQACIRFSYVWDQSNYGPWSCTSVTP